MIKAIVWLLIGSSGGHTSPSTLAVMNDGQACRAAAADLQQQSRDRSGGAFLYAYCIPVPAASLVRQ
jgi:hypothetical protein